MTVELGLAAIECNDKASYVDVFAFNRRYILVRLTIINLNSFHWWFIFCNWAPDKFLRYLFPHDFSSVFSFVIFPHVMKGGDGWSVAVLIVQVFTERNCFEGHQSQNRLKSYRTIYSIVGGFFKGRGEAGG